MQKTKKILAVVMAMIFAFAIPAAAYEYGTYEYEGTREQPMSIGLDDYYGNFSSGEDEHYYRITNNVWEYSEYVFRAGFAVAEETYQSNNVLVVSVENSNVAAVSARVTITDNDGAAVSNGSYVVDGGRDSEFHFRGMDTGYYLITIKPENAGQGLKYNLSVEREDNLLDTQEFNMLEMISNTVKYYWEKIVGWFIRY